MFLGRKWEGKISEKYAMRRFNFWPIFELRIMMFVKDLFSEYIVTYIHYVRHPSPASSDVTEEQLCQATIAAVM
jgi:hypothetical protein